MTIRIDNVAIGVMDLDEAIAFFTDLGLTLLGRDTVSDEWTDTAVGLDGNHAKMAMLQISLMLSRRHVASESKRRSR